MADHTLFKIIRGKKNFIVSRGGKAEGERNIRLILTCTRRRWKGIQLNLAGKEAEWWSFASASEAKDWCNFIQVPNTPSPVRKGKGKGKGRRIDTSNMTDLD